MKTTKLLFAILILLITNGISAQENTLKKESLPINSKNNCYLRYYYFPNLEAYFDNLKMVYYYKEKGEWVSAPELPENYGGYSLYNKARVTINNFDDDNPFQLILLHKKIYPYSSKGRFAYATTTGND
ncbi:hypothetical protein EZL74_05025 [Flavobacterium silvisoli]|uniref:Uncharacterized protein n=1 Tax=Flavobacterium silvisoli TaxID=2529433 RepID=A0A4Q9Z6C4_9FLAO|nr:hypothetical protein [Flavobacterium silvisoli]TBX70109.1 hypothetical protein EZL74_05025 [Flavobacterium silvisoli]